MGRALPLILMDVTFMKYSSEGCELWVTTVSATGLRMSGV